MTAAIPLYVLVAIILSSIVMVVTTETGLHRSPFCILPSLGITAMIWMAYPPAQQLSVFVGFLFWAMISLVMYYFPEPSTRSTTRQAPSTHDDELLDTFFKETPSYDH
jgi:hypothetical protein